MEHRHHFTLLQAVQSFMFDLVKYSRIEIKQAPIPKKTKDGLLAQLDAVVMTPKIVPLCDVELTDTEMATLSRHIKEDLMALGEFISSSSHFFKANKELRAIIFDRKIAAFKDYAPIQKIIRCPKYAFICGIEFYRYKNVCDLITLFGVMADGVNVFTTELDVNSPHKPNIAHFFKTFNRHLNNVYYETYNIMTEVEAKLSTRYDPRKLRNEFLYTPVECCIENEDDIDKLCENITELAERVVFIFDKITALEKKIESIVELYQENQKLAQEKHTLRPLYAKIFFHPTHFWNTNQNQRKIFILQQAQLNMILNRERASVALTQIRAFFAEIRKKGVDTSDSSQ